jgi:hypothetical protein
VKSARRSGLALLTKNRVFTQAGPKADIAGMEQRWLGAILKSVCATSARTTVLSFYASDGSSGAGRPTCESRR